MAKKRFTDIEIWDKEWFMDLTPKLKCLVRYLFDKCDASGVWNPNWKLASTHIKEQVGPDDLKGIPKDQYEILPGGKIFLPDFISFQYGKLSRECKPHVPILRLLDKHELTYRMGEVIEDYGTSIRATRKRLTDNAKKEVFEQDDYQCQYCGDRPGTENLFVDHIVALSAGGDNSWINLITACKSCNSKKHDDDVFLFIKKHQINPLKNLSEKLDTLFKNGNTLQEKDMDKEEETEKDKMGDGSEEPNTNPDSLLEQMATTFLESNPEYPIDRFTDLPMLRSIAEKILKWQKVTGAIILDSNRKIIKQRWGELVPCIRADGHLSKYSLTQLNKHFQSVVQTFNNGGNSNRSSPSASNGKPSGGKDAGANQLLGILQSQIKTAGSG